MSEVNLKRLWYMDWFGHVLDYDAANSRIYRRPLRMETLPDFFAIVPQPAILPSRAIFRQHSAMITKLPHIEMCDVAGGRIAFRDIASHQYLTINPRVDIAAFSAAEIYDWEKFLPLSEDDLKALALLHAPHLCEVKDSKGEVVYGFALGNVAENKGDIGIIGDFSFPLLRNLKAFSVLHGLEEGKSAKLELIGSEGTHQSFEVLLKKQEEEEEESA